MAETRATAFERVFRTTHDQLVAFCFRRVDDRELALDLAAEAFRIAWSRWDEPRRSDRAWLFGVARNLIGNEYTRRREHAVLPFGDDVPDPADPRTASGFEAVEVRRALATLAPVHQDVLRLTYWEGLGAAEAAEVLGTTPAAVWVRLTRARKAFDVAWRDRPAAPAPDAYQRPTRETR